MTEVDYQLCVFSPFLFFVFPSVLGFVCWSWKVAFIAAIVCTKFKFDCSLRIHQMESWLQSTFSQTIAARDAIRWVLFLFHFCVKDRKVKRRGVLPTSFVFWWERQEKGICGVRLGQKAQCDKMVRRKWKLWVKIRIMCFYGYRLGRCACYGLREACWIRRQYSSKEAIEGSHPSTFVSLELS